MLGQEPFRSLAIQISLKLHMADRKCRALNTCPLDHVKVVILGQDPYHNVGQAMGLSFSVPRGQPVPSSLKNIYSELRTDCQCTAPTHGDLQQVTQRWCAAVTFFTRMPSAWLDSRGRLTHVRPLSDQNGSFTVCDAHVSLTCTGYARHKQHLCQKKRFKTPQQPSPCVA